jgi:hypothetical protein
MGTSAIIKQSDLQPASFVSNSREDSLQIKLILRLIKTSIANSTPITVDDIRLLHAEYALTTLRNGVGWDWFVDPDGEKRWRRAKTVEEFFKSHSRPYISIHWFKANLGAAILKGRILAIPVIDI